jgi:hypothetical protein
MAWLLRPARSCEASHVMPHPTRAGVLASHLSPLTLTSMRTVHHSGLTHTRGDPCARRYRHHETGSKSEMPTLDDDGDRGWQGQLLQHMPLLVTPSSLDGGKTVTWAVRVVGLNIAQEIAILDVVTLEEDGCDGPTVAPGATNTTETVGATIATMRGLYRGQWHGLDDQAFDESLLPLSPNPQLESFARTSVCGMLEAYAPRGGHRVLLIGLGCCSIARFLSAHGKGAEAHGSSDDGEDTPPRVVVVRERSAAVISAVEEHWGGLPEGCTLEGEAAGDVLYDAVIVDDSIDDPRALRQCLAPDGLLLVAGVLDTRLVAMFPNCLVLREQRLRGTDQEGENQVVSDGERGPDKDAMQSANDDPATVFVAGGPASLSTEGWARATGALNPGSMDVAVAQRTRAVAVHSVVSVSEIAAIKAAAIKARESAAGIEVRSPPQINRESKSTQPVW